MKGASLVPHCEEGLFGPHGEEPRTLRGVSNREGLRCQVHRYGECLLSAQLRVHQERCRPSPIKGLSAPPDFREDQGTLNMKSNPKSITEIRSLARSHARTALNVLVLQGRRTDGETCEQRGLRVSLGQLWLSKLRLRRSIKWKAASNPGNFSLRLRLIRKWPFGPQSLL